MAAAVDTLVRQLGQPRSVTDSAPASDLVGQAVAPDNASATDTVQRQLSLARTTADSAPATDSAAAVSNPVPLAATSAGASTAAATLTVLGAVRLTATSAGLSVVTGTMSTAPPAPPGNDDFVSRETMTGDEDSAYFNLNGATVEVGETHYSEGKTVWYEWTATDDGYARFWSGNNHGTYIVAYRPTTGDTASSVTDLTEIATAYGIEVGSSFVELGDSRVFTAVYGRTYYFSVDRYDSSYPLEGTFSVEMTGVMKIKGEDTRWWVESCDDGGGFTSVVTESSGLIEGVTINSMTIDYNPFSSGPLTYQVAPVLTVNVTVETAGTWELSGILSMRLPSNEVGGFTDYQFLGLLNPVAPAVRSVTTAGASAFTLTARVSAGSGDVTEPVPGVVPSGDMFVDSLYAATDTSNALTRSFTVNNGGGAIAAFTGVAYVAHPGGAEGIDVFPGVNGDGLPVNVTDGTTVETFTPFDCHPLLIRTATGWCEVACMCLELSTEPAELVVLGGNGGFGDFEESTITIPSSVNVGNFMLLATVRMRTATTPADFGFEEVLSVSSFAAGLKVWTKTADISDAGTTLNFGSNGGTWGVDLRVYSKNSEMSVEAASGQLHGVVPNVLTPVVGLSAAATVVSYFVLDASFSSGALTIPATTNLNNHNTAGTGYGTVTSGDWYEEGSVTEAKYAQNGASGSGSTGFLTDWATATVVLR